MSTWQHARALGSAACAEGRGRKHDYGHTSSAPHGGDRTSDNPWRLSLSKKSIYCRGSKKCVQNGMHITTREGLCMTSVWFMFGKLPLAPM